nr:3-phosphoshikimate 1-carboxyvinyltransferase [Bacteroidales bacterium]
MQTIRPGKIIGTLQAPASKSMMQRAIAIACLAQGTSVLHGYTPSNDSDAALGIAFDLGSDVVVDGKTVTIEGDFSPRLLTLSCGESGLGIRMFTPIASLWHQKITLTGEGSLKTRPISMLVEPLRELGVEVFTKYGYVPVEVSGPIRGGKAQLDGSLSSQILTGLLIASPLAQHDTEFHVSNLKSKPYVDMTLQIMQDFGVEAINENYELFRVAAQQSYIPQEYTVEGDWSGASFLLVAGALGGSVRVENVRTDSKQADIAILDALASAGAHIEKDERAVTVSHRKLQAFEFDATECPDLFPPLVALAAHCTGTSVIKGVSRLQFKESDRAVVLQTECAKLGIRIENKGDEMFVYGGTVSGGRMHANNDHRIAMAGACIAI